jgi:hypothetical protein
MQRKSSQLVTLQAQLAVLSRTIAEIQRELKAAPPARAAAGAVRTGAPSYRLLGQEFLARNANDTLVSVFRHFAELEPEFPEHFRRAARYLGRSRPYVGGSPQEVYPGKPKLWPETAEFAPGWYVGTNENNSTKIKLLREACKVIGLRFGVDLQVQ